MNWPNRLSILRVLCIPLIILFLSLSQTWCAFTGTVLFALASFTDFLDGYLARKFHLITVFGKFIDPVADKLLVLSTLIMLSSLGFMPAWTVILILARELSVDGLRLVAISRGKVISAGPLGKIKTTSQMILILMLLIIRQPVFSFPAGLVGTLWVCGITLWSGVDYFIRNREVLKEEI